jgi:hypothetical protein
MKNHIEKYHSNREQFCPKQTHNEHISSFGKVLCNGRWSQKMKDSASGNEDKYITEK